MVDGAHFVLGLDAAGDQVVLAVGELDLAAAPALGRALAEVARSKGAVVALDLARVTFMDCSALRELFRAREALGVRLVLQAVPPPVALLLELTGTTAGFAVRVPPVAPLPLPRLGATADSGDAGPLRQGRPSLAVECSRPTP